jgi:hypothetical protein
MSSRSFRLCSYLAALPLMALLSLPLAAQIQPRPQDAAQNQTQDARQAPPNAVVEGTIFLIQLTDRIDTSKVKAGDRFHAVLAEPLVTPNGMTLEEGRKIKGHISAIEPGLHTRILLSFDDIELPHGKAPLIATVTGVPGEHGMRPVGEEGEIGRKGMSKEEIAEAVIVGAGKGAAEGQRNGGGKKGAAEGAGAGAANAASTAFESGHDLILDSGTALEIRLDRNLMLR